MSQQENQQTLSPFARTFQDENGRYPNWTPTFGQLCTSTKNLPARIVLNDAEHGPMCVVVVPGNDFVVTKATPHLPDHKPSYKVIDFAELEKLNNAGRFK